MPEDDLEAVRRGYAAFSAGDLAAVTELFTEDATWVVPGSNPLTGTKAGRDAIVAFLIQLATLSEGTFRTTQLALAEADGRVFSLDRNQGTRAGKSLDATGVNVFEVKDGRTLSVQSYYENTTENDAFWS